MLYLLTGQHKIHPQRTSRQPTHQSPRRCVLEYSRAQRAGWGVSGAVSRCLPVPPPYQLNFFHQRGVSAKFFFSSSLFELLFTLICSGSDPPSLHTRSPPHRRSITRAPWRRLILPLLLSLFAILAPSSGLSSPSSSPSRATTPAPAALASRAPRQGTCNRSLHTPPLSCCISSPAITEATSGMPQLSLKASIKVDDCKPLARGPCPRRRERS